MESETLLVDKMDAVRAVELVNAAIEHAEFDRKRFKVTAREGVIGDVVEVYADTIRSNAEGKLSTNYNPIRLDDVTDDLACAEQLRMVVESMVESLDDFVNSKGLSLGEEGDERRTREED